jgi:hypothetical protein
MNTLFAPRHVAHIVKALAPRPRKRTLPGLGSTRRPPPDYGDEAGLRQIICYLTANPPSLPIQAESISGGLAGRTMMS